MTFFLCQIEFFHRSRPYENKRKRSDDFWNHFSTGSVNRTLARAAISLQNSSSVMTAHRNTPSESWHFSCHWPLRIACRVRTSFSRNSGMSREEPSIFCTKLTRQRYSEAQWMDSGTVGSRRYSRMTGCGIRQIFERIPVIRKFMTYDWKKGKNKNQFQQNFHIFHEQSTSMASKFPYTHSFCSFRKIS